LRLRRELAARPPDIVHAHNVRATVAAAAGRAARRPAPVLLTTVHGLGDDDYPRAARLLRGCGATVVAVSEDVAERLTAAGLPRARVAVVENAVPAPPAPDREAVRAELGVPAGVPVVLCAARLAPPKRVDLLLDAWPQVPDAVLLLAGDGPDRAAVERAAHDQPRVRVLGDRRDVGRLLGAADLLVLPSDREGLPMSVLEAMAAGVPVVASAVGGLLGLPAEALTRVPPGSAAELGAAVASLLGDEAARRRQASAARALVGQRYSSERMGAAYGTIYTGLAERGNS
jgi:glycosyltransferase involved in cell wall biosynthesis